MLADSFFEQWNLVRQGTIATAERVPDNGLDFRPHPDIMNLGELNFHIISSAYFLLRRRLALEITIPQLVKDKLPLGREAFLSELRATDEIVQKALQTFEPADLQQPAYTDKSGKVWTKGYILWHVGEHEVHHRAQLRLYLKLMDLDTSGLPY